MIGQTVSHFKILEKLAEGGMGIVYKAQDISLDRTVALKLLPSRTVVSDDDKARFCNEARAAAKLAQPNIATVYLFTSDRNLLRASETMSRQSAGGRCEMSQERFCPAVPEYRGASG